MKILSICAGDYPTSEHEVTVSTLDASTPFGYDLVVVNAANMIAMYGVAMGHSGIDTRWHNYITKWALGNRKIIVFTNNLDISALQWLPISQSAYVELTNLQPAGSSNYLGQITSTDPLLRRFLTENKESFTVNRYLKVTSPEGADITASSGVDSSLLTSFTYRKDDLEVIFIPFISVKHLLPLFSALDTPANAWGLTAADELNTRIETIDGKINTLHTQRDALYGELNTLNSSINDVIKDDVYLTRAIGHYNASKTSEHPSPESYYGAIEAIENAFSSEREMREELDLSKAFIDKVMRRANGFRHEAKSGTAPAPLTDDEITDFNGRVNKVISNYIQYLLKQAD